MEKLIEEFGCQQLTDDLVNLFNHPGLQHLYQCGILAAHRDLDILIKSGLPFYIYTGRGPSSGSLHIGHIIPFLVSKYIQDIYHVPVFVQLSTDEKYMRDHLTMEQVESMAYTNATDIMSLGFDPKLTCIMSNMDMIETMYPTILNIMRHTSMNTVLNTFGHYDGDDVGKFFFPIVEAAPAFASALPNIIPAKYERCLVILGIDQDPYFRIAREVAHALGENKPALLHTTFIPGLMGMKTKMSASDPMSAIFLSDSDEEIGRKIIKHAFSGGRATLAEHRQLGAIVEDDVSCRYLQVFGGLIGVDYSDLIDGYRAGKVMTRQLKNEAVSCLIQVAQRLYRNPTSLISVATEPCSSPASLMRLVMEPRLLD